jgi:uncharacterized protein YjbJ (UPF0337 family)/ElaB/YqjD/DUF883 family membrane-anchored ribosome-binding protein
MENEVGAVHSENEEAILRDMEETRTALTEKLETLEQKLVETVNQTTSAVTETVASVKETVNETVSAVKMSVTDTVSTVKETMHEGVETVKGAFDLSAHVEHHPWLMMGGSVLAGYALGRVLSEPSPRMESARSYSPSPFPPLRENAAFSGTGHQRAPSAPSAPVQAAQAATSAVGSVASSLMSTFAPEIDKLKSLALGVTMGTVRDLVVDAVPPQLSGQIREVIDNVTRKMGGEPVAGADVPYLKSFIESFRGHSRQGGRSSDFASRRSWEEIKDKTKRIWNDITDMDLQRCKGDFDSLVNVIQERTGETREQIRKTLEESNGHHAAY